VKSELESARRFALFQSIAVRRLAGIKISLSLGLLDPGYEMAWKASRGGFVILTAQVGDRGGAGRAGACADLLRP